MPATAESTALSGRRDRCSSRRKTHKPIRAPAATRTPKLVISKSPMRKKTGKMGISSGLARAQGYSGDRRSRSAFPITDTELNVIAALAIIGLSRRPKKGYSTPAAIGTPTTL